jgi:hypothetical protein
MALAHTIENKVEAAYRRGDLFTKRCANERLGKILYPRCAHRSRTDRIDVSRIPHNHAVALPAFDGDPPGRIFAWTARLRGFEKRSAQLFKPYYLKQLIRRCCCLKYGDRENNGGNTKLSAMLI